MKTANLAVCRTPGRHSPGCLFIRLETYKTWIHSDLETVFTPVHRLWKKIKLSLSRIPAKRNQTVNILFYKRVQILNLIIIVGKNKIFTSIVPKNCKNKKEKEALSGAVSF